MHGDWGVTDYRGVNVASNQLNLLNVHFTSPDVSIHLFLEELKFRTFNFAIFLIFTFSHIFFSQFYPSALYHYNDKTEKKYD